MLTDATEAFYNTNCVEEEAGKFRCPLSGKLFREPGFVRKHIDNKHAPAPLGLGLELGLGLGLELGLGLGLGSGSF